MNKDPQTLKHISQAGTGFMASLSETIRQLEKEGYDENLSVKYDHFACPRGGVELFPEEFEVDKVVRFENTSDPDDQSILYAISSPEKDIKGLYVESYGLYHEELSPKMLKKLSDGCRHEDC